jgi:hypothetical protein
MLEDFLSFAAITTVACLVIALPLWGVAVWRRTWTVALWFVAAAVILSVAFGLLAVESESSFAACKASDGFGCGNAGFVLAGLWLMALVGYFIAGIVAAIVVEYQGAQTAEAESDFLWCDRCVDLVAVAGHEPGHTLRPRWITQKCYNCGTRSAIRQWQRELIHRDRQHKTFRFRCPQCNESFLKTENVGDGGFFGGPERPPS